MLDFNDTSPPGETGRRNVNDSERDEIRTELIARMESVLTTMFPAGKKRRGKFLIGDILGSPGDSLEVVLEGDKAGLWTDRATGDGGDIFALIAAYLGANVHTDFPRVLDEAADLLGRSRSVPVRRAKKEAPVDDLGPATAKWDYFDATGKLIAVVYRYDPPGRKKEFRPWDAKRRKMTPPDPRPLYNQPGLAAAGHVVLVEGEKCAQALIAIGVVATTAMHGANAPVDKTDWSPLAGKSVLIWPDRDAPGWDYADRASQAILNAGATTVAILVPPDDKPEGWDAADAIPDGFDVRGFLAVGERMPVIGSADRCRLDYGGRLVLGLHTPLWRGLALLRALGQMAGLDRRALESGSGALCVSSGAWYLPDGVTQGGQPSTHRQAGQLRHDLVRRENRTLRSQARVHRRGVGCRRLGAQLTRRCG